MLSTSASRVGYMMSLCPVEKALIFAVLVALLFMGFTACRLGFKQLPESVIQCFAVPFLLWKQFTHQNKGAMEGKTLHTNPSFGEGPLII